MRPIRFCELVMMCEYGRCQYDKLGVIKLLVEDSRYVSHHWINRLKHRIPHFRALQLERVRPIGVASSSRGMHDAIRSSPAFRPDAFHFQHLTMYEIASCRRSH